MSQSRNPEIRDSERNAARDVSLHQVKTHAALKSGRMHGTAVLACPHCSSEIMTGSAYCSTCGQRKTGKIENCIYCGKKLPLSIKFCEACDV